MCACKRNDKYEVCSYPTGTLYKFYPTKRTILTFVSFCPWAFPYRRKREVWISISPHAFLHKGRGFNLLMSTLSNSNISCTAGWPWKLKICTGMNKHLQYWCSPRVQSVHSLATSAPPTPHPPPLPSTRAAAGGESLNPQIYHMPSVQSSTQARWGFFLDVHIFVCFSVWSDQYVELQDQ